jgi:hypothetical protein
MIPETEIEQEFQKVFDAHHEEIQSKLREASRLIDEASALSEKYGIPFCPDDDIMWCRPSFVPDSFKAKFPDIDDEFVYELCEAYPGVEYTGWQVSQTC